MAHVVDSRQVLLKERWNMKKKLGICIVLVIGAVIAVLFAASQIKVFSGADNLWSAVFMNTENQNDGTWSGYLVCDEKEAETIENLRITAYVDSEKKYDGALPPADDNIGFLYKLFSGTFNKTFYGFYSFDDKPESVSIKIEWTQGEGQHKKKFSQVIE